MFAEQRVPGTLQVWAEPFVELRVPLMFNLRTDPFERAQITSNTYYDWMLDRVYLIIPSQRIVGEFLQTFMEYPPRMKAASFTVDQVMAKMEQSFDNLKPQDDRQAQPPRLVAPAAHVLCFGQEYRSPPSAKC